MWRRGKGRGEEQTRQRAEDLLKGLAERGWLERAWGVEELLHGAVAAVKEAVLERLLAAGQVQREGAQWRLTAAGRGRAVELLRAHRLVETYLARKEGRPADALHAEADRAEHYISAEGVNALADLMNRPRFDPHGDPIPQRARDLRPVEQMHLSDVAAGDVVRIAHIEDEPEEDFERMSAMGLALELPLRVLAQSDRETVIELAGERIALSSRMAAHVEVTPLAAGEVYPDNLRRLAQLKQGETGIVEFISAACLGPERRRLLDFGMVPGSEVRREFASPFGSPVAYSVRGTTIGLRRAQAENIFIRRPS